jgi:hypothetical protein
LLKNITDFTEFMIFLFLVDVKVGSLFAGVRTRHARELGCRRDRSLPKASTRHEDQASHADLWSQMLKEAVSAPACASIASARQIRAKGDWASAQLGAP